MIKAIETTYSGVRFRSRTEARWAVFFDACGIKWEYEPEAFRLSDGSCYLPDFRVRGMAGGACPGCPTCPPASTFVEVKPENGARGLDLVSRFSNEAYQERGDFTYVVRGAPTENRDTSFPEYPFTFKRQVFLRAVAAARSHRFWDPVRR